MTVQSPTTSFTPPAKYENAAEWWHALGDVPLERIVMDPWPGTATEQDLIAFVDGDNKRLVELVNGTLVEKTVGWFEALIATRLAMAMGEFVQSHRLGIVLGPDATLRMASKNVRLPDVSFISVRDLPGGGLPPTDQAVVTLTPTIAVEVLSQGNTKREMRLKLDEYFGSGTRLAWIINPRTRTIAVYDRAADEPTKTLREDEMLEGGDVLPGFSVSIASLLKSKL